ncbi:hypothetical protein VN97_g12355, partial [Penicillium thymicola]
MAARDGGNLYINSRVERTNTRWWWAWHLSSITLSTIQYNSIQIQFRFSPDSVQIQFRFSSDSVQIQF